MQRSSESIPKSTSLRSVLQDGPSSAGSGEAKPPPRTGNSGRDSLVSKDVGNERMRSLVQLRESIASIATSQKAAYVEACMLAPQLVETESDPRRFLHLEQGHPFIAALRLITYWDRRKNFFGDRALLPMDLTGDGALSKGDITVLKNGHFSILPPDKNGRPVYYVASSNAELWLKNREAANRCIFYLLANASENDVAQKVGAVVLLELQSVSEVFDSTFLRIFVELARNAMPIKFARLHVLSCPANPTPRTFFDNVLPRTLQLIDSFLKTMRELHICSSREEMVHELETFGLVEEGLPFSIGGSWNPQLQFRTSQYQNKRRGTPITDELESRKPKSRPKEVGKPRSPPISPLESRMSASIVASNIVDPKQKTLFGSLLSKSDPDQEKRQSSFTSIASGVEPEVPQSSSKAARKLKNADYKIADSNLSVIKPSASWLGDYDANGTDDSPTPSDIAVERKKILQRKKNAIYSRKSYNRKKVGFEVLVARSDKLATENYNLKHEMNRLEKLLAEAEQILALYKPYTHHLSASPPFQRQSPQLNADTANPTPNWANVLPAARAPVPPESSSDVQSLLLPLLSGNTPTSCPEAATPPAPRLWLLQQLLSNHHPTSYLQPRSWFALGTDLFRQPQIEQLMRSPLQQRSAPQPEHQQDQH